MLIGAALLLGHPGWLVSVLFLLSVPLTALSALRFFHRLVPGRVVGSGSANRGRKTHGTAAE